MVVELKLSLVAHQTQVFTHTNSLPFFMEFLHCVDLSATLLILIFHVFFCLCVCFNTQISAGGLDKRVDSSRAPRLLVVWQHTSASKVHPPFYLYIQPRLISLFSSSLQWLYFLTYFFYFAWQIQDFTFFAISPRGRFTSLHFVTEAPHMIFISRHSKAFSSGNVLLFQ